VKNDSGRRTGLGRAVLCFLLLAACAAAAIGQDSEPPENPGKLDELIVTASRREAAVFDVPYFADVLDEFEIFRKGSATLPDVFREDPSIMVQKTSQGQGSPFIRGFTGFRTLLLIDGIRLNNSAFREGPNQYWNTVDPLSLSRVEIVKGPSSVLYGSDAIGGTVNAITRSPQSYGEGFNIGGRTVYRYGSADRSHIGRLELDASVDSTFGILAGFSLKDFNDVRAGGSTGNQPKTGYDEGDADVKLEYFLNPESKLIFAHQHVWQDDAWRTHRTIYAKSWHGTAIGAEKEWSFDQERDLTYLQYQVARLGPLPGNATISLSYHRQAEEQFRIRANDKTDRQGFSVGTIGFSSIFENVESTLGLLSYGFEYYRDNVNSFARKYTAGGQLEKVEVQGPVADDATYDLMGVFLQDEFPIFDRLTGIAGVRYTHAQAAAEKMLNPVTGGQGSISDSWDNVSASFRLQYNVDDACNIFSGVSQGFRAPNLSDLTRLDSARSNEIETPSPGLDPEKYVAYEAGVKTDNEHWRGTASYFYTTIRDMITRYPTGSMIDGRNEVQKANSGDGYVHGIDVQAEYKLAEQWTPFAALAWQEGKVDTYATSAASKTREPISRIPPLAAVAGMRWQPPSRRLWIELLSRTAVRQNRLSPEDKADTQRIPPGGTPGYTVFDIRAGITPVKDVAISAAVENITNRDYRIHGSGQNEPGTNLIVSAECKF